MPNISRGCYTRMSNDSSTSLAPDHVRDDKELVLACININKPY